MCGKNSKGITRHHGFDFFESFSLVDLNDLVVLSDFKRSHYSIKT